jgi:hypothetical protein
MELGMTMARNGKVRMELSGVSYPRSTRGRHIMLLSENVPDDESIQRSKLLLEKNRTVGKMREESILTVEEDR